MTPSMRKRFERKAMNIKPIRTKANYRAALKDIESLMTAKANTPLPSTASGVSAFDSWMATHTTSRSATTTERARVA